MDEQQQAVKEMSLDQAVASVVSGLPESVRDFVTGPDRDRVIMDISQKYQLHVDQAGEFQRALIFMLLGITSPEEFADDLQGVGLNPEAIKGIANDVNERVFIPLREKEQQASENPPAAPASRPAPLPPPAITMQTPAAAPIPAPVPVAPAPTPLPRPTPAPVPARPTEFVPENLPGAPVAPAPQQAASVPPAPKPPEPSAARQELHDVLKSYGVDPYRETPE